MSIQFQTQYLLDEGAATWLKGELIELGAGEDTANMLASAVEAGHITPEKAVAIVKDVAQGKQEEGSMAAGAGGFSPSLHASEKKIKGPELEEDAPILAGGKIKDNYAVSHFGYKEAPKGHAKLKGVMVKDLWKEGEINENYHRFKKETATRTKAQQMHEAAKAIEKRLNEVNKLLEYTNELKNELFEGDTESQMTHHTKKVFERVTRNVAEAYSKLKKIK